MNERKIESLKSELADTFQTDRIDTFDSTIRRFTSADHHGAWWTRNHSWRMRRQTLLDATGGFCQICGRNTRRMIADHIDPVRSGGDPLGALQILCSKCHNQKTAKETAERRKR